MVVVDGEDQATVVFAASQLNAITGGGPEESHPLLLDLRCDVFRIAPGFPIVVAMDQ